MQPLFKLNQKGNLVFSLALAGIFSFISAGIVTLIISRINSSALQKKSSQSRLLISAAIETFSIAVKHAEIRYFISMRNCQTANLFIQSLTEGHKCVANQSATINTFTADDLGGLAADEKALFSYVGGWRINYNTAASGPTDRKVLTLKVQNLPVSFYFHGSSIQKDRSDFTAVLDTPTGQYKSQFSIFTSDSPNKIHLNGSDVKLVNQRSYGKDPCTNLPWTQFNMLSGGACIQAANLAGGSGLSYYDGNYFGLRTSDGQIISMRDFNGATYLVSEAGALGGANVFPAHERDALVNIDDFEVSGTDQDLKQIFAVSGTGIDSVLSYYDHSTQQLIPLCKLGEMDFGRSFSGLAIAPGNQNIMDNSSSMTANTATFYLKSDSGESIVVGVKVLRTNPYTLEAQYLTTLSGSRTAICVAIKDIREQEIEHSRTLGLTRGGLILRPYYIY